MAMLLFFGAIPGAFILYYCFLALGFVLLPISLCAAAALAINTPLPVRERNARVVAGLSLALNLFLLLLLRYAFPAWALRGWVLCLLASLPPLGAALKADNYSTALLYGAWPGMLLLAYCSLHRIFGAPPGLVDIGVSALYLLVTVAGASFGYFFNWLTTPMEAA